MVVADMIPSATPVMWGVVLSLAYFLNITVPLPFLSLCATISNNILVSGPSFLSDEWLRFFSYDDSPSCQMRHWNSFFTSHLRGLLVSDNMATFFCTFPLSVLGKTLRLSTFSQNLQSSNCKTARDHSHVNERDVSAVRYRFKCWKKISSKVPKIISFVK